ncbi:hypothetical protein [Streptomyces niveus]|uniref:hypothetical protein n=1 Tax=Streptomyces niveus TaxID=193462 RepID=UPI001331A8D3|nr:hypothetical protein [Streptomyces niveus]
MNSGTTAGSNYQVSRVMLSCSASLTRRPRAKKVRGQGAWSVKEKGSIVELIYDSTGSFAEGGEAGSLGVADSGDPLKLYFSTNSENEYGYEIQKSD